MESIVASLALLACPLGMGAMMWFMMRGMKQPPSRPGDDDELTALRTEQRSLEAELGRLRRPEDVAADPIVRHGA